MANNGRNNFFGLVVYRYVNDGCWTGIWNNNHSGNLGHSFTEIIRKEVSGTDSPTDIVGTYRSSWIEGQDPPISARLDIHLPIVDNSHELF